MEWRIQRCCKDETIRFAAEELARYLGKIDSRAQTAILRPEGTTPAEGILKLQAGGCDKLPKAANPELDDAYYIDVHNGVGVIAGVNARSVLLGVYRLLRELGCRWLRPGAKGEIIPQRDIASCAVTCSDSASYRHRGVCIEGTCSYTHVADIIDWMPKIGMNAYYDQFFVPYTFYDQWYRHEGNPHMKPEPASVDEVRAMVNANIDNLKKRGMLYHATGHGWTCEPLGIEGNSWVKKDYFVPEDMRGYLAMIDGKREIFERISLNTNLCYSNPKVQELVASSIANYCEKHSEVDYLHFWLADGSNNHCECEDCQKLPPSDFYVQILNEIDRRLTLKSIDTKIVFLIYVDLLWEPQVERLKNQDRFVLMFAPITRTYTNTFCHADSEETYVLEPYVRNKLTMPKQVGENIQRLRKWQEQFTGDSFDYDYHLIWDHNFDLGGYSTARVLFEDMKNLDKLGINGMMSCQCQRVFFPTGLSMYGMGAALWDKKLEFEDVASAYYADLFGEYGEKMHSYFKTISRLCDPPYRRGEKPVVCEETARQFAEINNVVNEILPFLHEALEKECDHCRIRTWQSLIAHAQLCVYMAGVLTQQAKGNNELALEQWEAVKDYVHRMEPELHDLFDVRYFVNVNGRALNEKQPYALEE